MPARRTAASTTVPGPSSGGIARSPKRRDTTPVPVSATTNGRAVSENARNDRREPVPHGARTAAHAPTSAIADANSAATTGFQFGSGGAARSAAHAQECVRAFGAGGRRDWRRVIEHDRELPRGDVAQTVRRPDLYDPRSVGTRKRERSRVGSPR